MMLRDRQLANFAIPVRDSTALSIRLRLCLRIIPPFQTPAVKLAGGHGTRLLKAFVATVHTGQRLISVKSGTVFPPLCSTAIQRQSGSDLWGQRASCPLIVPAPEHCGEAAQVRAGRA